MKGEAKVRPLMTIYESLCTVQQGTRNVLSIALFTERTSIFFISIFNLLLHLSKLGKVEQSSKDL